MVSINTGYAKDGLIKLMDGTQSRQFVDEVGNLVTKFSLKDGRTITRRVGSTRSIIDVLNPKTGAEISREYGRNGNYVRLYKSYPGELPSSREISVGTNGKVERIEINNPHNHKLYDYPNNTLWTRQNGEPYQTNGCSAGMAPVSAAEAIRANHLL